MKKFRIYDMADLDRVGEKHDRKQDQLRKTADYLISAPDHWSSHTLKRVDCVGFHTLAVFVPKRRRQWVYERKINAVTLGDPATGGWIYQVDLDRCRSAKEVIDWIGQISGKTWATDRDLGGLVRILDAVLDLQQKFVWNAKVAN